MSGYLERLKEPALALTAIVGLAVTFGGGFLAGAHWYVSSEMEPLRREITGLKKIIEDSRSKMSNNGERLAGVEATLSGTGERIGRLHNQVTKNAEEITDLKIRGTPGP